MKTQWLDQTIAYDGSQLRAHWILRATGLVGDGVVAFRGPCRDDFGYASVRMREMRSLFFPRRVRARGAGVKVHDSTQLLRSGSTVSSE